MAVVTNIENDHLASDDELPALARAFAEFLAKLPDDGLAVIGVDNPLSASLTAHDLRARVVTFGLDPRRRCARTNQEFSGFGSAFDVRRRRSFARAGRTARSRRDERAERAGRDRGRSGRSTCRSIRSPRRCASFRGVRRRFDVLLSNERVTVVDDYAHHPTAVRATIAAARHGSSRRRWSSRFSRTDTRARPFLAREFAAALRGADRVYLAPVYAASEPAIPGVSERSIGEALATLGAPRRVRRLARRAREQALRRESRRSDAADARRGRHHRHGGAISTTLSQPAPSRAASLRG